VRSELDALREYKLPNKLPRIGSFSNFSEHIGVGVVVPAPLAVADREPPETLESSEILETESPEAPTFPLHTVDVLGL
jgi:hypothetical protein